MIPQPTPTHAFNSNSGYVPLTFSQTAGGLTVTGPPNGNIAPPGMYMMFVINANGVPSVASWVHVSAAGQASLTARLTAKRDSGWKLLSRWESPTSAATPPAPTPSAPTSIFPSLTPGAAAPGESIGSYGKRIVCTLDRNRDSSRTALKRGPP